MRTLRNGVTSHLWFVAMWRFFFVVPPFRRNLQLLQKLDVIGTIQTATGHVNEHGDDEATCSVAIRSAA